MRESVPYRTSFSQILLPLAMHDACPECERLTAKYAEATKSYFEFLLKSQLARNANNPVLLSKLEALKLTAYEERGIARLELRQHEATQHPKANGQTA
jgi:hypothetical protein